MDFRTSCFGYNRKEVARYVEQLTSLVFSLREENKQQKQELQIARQSVDELQAELAVKKDILQNCYQFSSHKSGVG